MKRVIAVLASTLHRQTRLLDSTLHQVKDRDLDKSLSVTLLMIQSLGVSIHSVLKLTAQKDMAIRDCFGIARSAAELAVNICYITVSGDEVVSRAERHAMQKFYRDMDRSGSIGGWAFKVAVQDRPPAENIAGLTEAIAEFTGKKGQELPEWTPLSISARVDSVREANRQAGMALSGAIIAIYRHASEFLHGTYFSALYFWQSPSTEEFSKGAFLSRWDEHFVTVFMALFFATTAVLTVFADKYDLGDVAMENSEILDAVTQLVEKITKN